MRFYLESTNARKSSAAIRAVKAPIPPELRRRRFKAPDALIASPLEDASPICGVTIVGQPAVTTNILDPIPRGDSTMPSS